MFVVKIKNKANANNKVNEKNGLNKKKIRKNTKHMQCEFSAKYLLYLMYN